MNTSTNYSILALVVASTACSANAGAPEESVASSKSAVSAGWTVVPTQNSGTGDNVLAAVSGSATNDVWAVGQIIPDDNANVTQTLAHHYDGAVWTPVPTPNVGSNANSFAGVAAREGKAWAVGYYQDSNWVSRSLIEGWDGTSWRVIDHPQVGAGGDHLQAVSSDSVDDSWAAGWKRNASGTFSTLVEHFDGTAWSVVPTPNPGVNGNLLYGIFARSSHDIWAVGQQVGASGPDQALILHWDGSAFTSVSSPSNGENSTDLLAVTGDDQAVIRAIGDGEDFMSGTKSVAEINANGTWTRESAPSPGPTDNHLQGIAILSDGTAVVVGEYIDAISGNNFTLIEINRGHGWEQVPSPTTNTAGDNFLGGVTQVGHDVWAVGTSDGANALQTVILHYSL
ncbi:MAG: hypothetical protein ABTD50_14315 [Polyangiaceae bacterium]|jgi:hypothetical protein